MVLYKTCRASTPGMVHMTLKAPCAQAQSLCSVWGVTAFRNGFETRSCSYELIKRAMRPLAMLETHGDRAGASSAAMKFLPPRDISRSLLVNAWMKFKTAPLPADKHALDCV